ncbi:HK97 gp10 family phage protein [Limnoglobus roseus]|uniref:HK97 gp10 family phage protein n=1 Tax=Limnoglobus roseus TaxID=2598579 RepID=UPI00143CE487|nr:HK97 gp10 family phage protein [Limnoglobus roseus]
MAVHKIKLNVQDKFMRIAINAGAAPAKAQMVETVPSDTGALKKSIRIKIAHYRRKQLWFVFIGAKTKFVVKGKQATKKKPKRNEKQPSRYFKNIDQGTSKLRGRQFVRRILPSAESQFQERFCGKMRELINSQG